MRTNHPSPVPVVDVNVVLDDPPVGDLEMPAVCPLVANGGHDARRFARLDDHHHVVRLSPFEVRVNELITPAPPGCLHNRNIPLFGPTFQPLLELIGDAAPHVAAHQV